MCIYIVLPCTVKHKMHKMFQGSKLFLQLRNQGFKTCAVFAFLGMNPSWELVCSWQLTVSWWNSLCRKESYLYLVFMGGTSKLPVVQKHSIAFILRGFCKLYLPRLSCASEPFGLSPGKILSIQQINFLLWYIVRKHWKGISDL